MIHSLTVTLYIWRSMVYWEPNLTGGKVLNVKPCEDPPSPVVPGFVLLSKAKFGGVFGIECPWLVFVNITLLVSQWNKCVHSLARCIYHWNYVDFGIVFWIHYIWCWFLLSSLVVGWLFSHLAADVPLTVRLRRLLSIITLCVDFTSLFTYFL